MKFSRALQAIRAVYGISQEALAVEIGVSRNTVSNWERDATVPDVDELMRIVRRFGVRLSLDATGWHIEV